MPTEDSDQHISLESTLALFKDDPSDHADFDLDIQDSEQSAEVAHVSTAAPAGKRIKPGTLITRELLQGLTPSLITDTSKPFEEHYVPRVPEAASDPKLKRQLILDTETTGFNAQTGDRIIEIGIVEFMNRRPTGSKFHVYLNPQRGMDEDAIRVHGIESEFLASMPLFADIAPLLFEFLKGAELIAHNAPFDVGFLHEEFKNAGFEHFQQQVSVTDTLALAKAKFPGQRNSLDALVKRLEVVNRDRTCHGALLDAEILADVYLSLTGGQVSLSLAEEVGSGSKDHKRLSTNVFARTLASESDLVSHQGYLAEFFSDTPEVLERWS